MATEEEPPWDDMHPSDQENYLAAREAEENALNRFVRAAAKSVTTDGADEWNEMVDAWEQLSEAQRAGLLEQERGE